MCEKEKDLSVTEIQLADAMLNFAMQRRATVELKFFDRVMTVTPEMKYVDARASLKVILPRVERDLLKDKPLFMRVRESFYVTGRGVIILGYIEEGTLNVGDELEIILEDETKCFSCVGIEIFRDMVQSASAGSDVGVLVKGISRKEIQNGVVIKKAMS